MGAVFGDISSNHLLFYLAVWAPAMATPAIVLRKSRWAGARRFLGRLLLWRASVAWLPVSLAWHSSPLFDRGGLEGPVEEIECRGFPLLLQRSTSLPRAGIVLGIVWGIWHLPAFLLSGTPQSAWSFTDVFGRTIALSVIAAALFNAPRGSIVRTALFHLQVTNSLRPDAQPYDTAPLIASAFVVTGLNQDVMLRRAGPTTSVSSTCTLRPVGWAAGRMSGVRWVPPSGLAHRVLKVHYGCGLQSPRGFLGHTCATVPAKTHVPAPLPCLGIA